MAAEIARRLRAALEGRTQEAVAAEAGLAHSTISKLTRGETWPDVQTVVRLEDALGTELWPCSPRRP
ncbi:MAG: helix-turn-helix domain-containing protein [Iamia sp.]